MGLNYYIYIFYKVINNSIILVFILYITFHFLTYLFNKNILINYYNTCSMINLNSRVSAKVAKYLINFFRREDPMKLKIIYIIKIKKIFIFWGKIKFFYMCRSLYKVVCSTNYIYMI